LVQLCLFGTLLLEKNVGITERSLSSLCSMQRQTNCCDFEHIST